MKITKKKSAKQGLSEGSALILAVVLTSLLAIIGVFFVLVARVDQTASMAIVQHRDLDLAVETVLSKICEELVLDVPGAAGPAEEYYDYPDPCNAWLACLEPSLDDGGTPLVPDDDRFYWRQTSDVYEVLEWPRSGWARIVPASQEARYGLAADADGDGVSDANWFELPEVRSSKGLPIYAAVRVIDNGGMINVNTGYKFDPTMLDPTRIDGSSLMQIDLAGIARKLPPDHKTPEAIDVLHAFRAGLADPCAIYADPLHFELFEKGCVWMIEAPNPVYAPFDISDELALRNGYLLKQKNATTPLQAVWHVTFAAGGGYSKLEPYMYEAKLGAWFNKASADRTIDPNWYYRPHIATTYNMDRIISPDGGRMANLMWHDKVSLYEAIRRWADEMIQRGLLDVVVGDPNTDPNAVAAQIAVNIIDFRDGPGYDPSDHNYEAPDEPTVFLNPDDGLNYYGFERPCVYISELASVYQVDPNDPNLVHRSYAVEFHKPYAEDNDPCGWQLAIYNRDDPVTPDRQYDIDWTGSSRFHAIVFENPQAPLLPLADFNDANDTEDPNSSEPNAAPTAYYIGDGESIFDTQYDLQLQRPAGGSYAVVDSVEVPAWLVTRLDSDACQVSYQRDITRHKCIRRLWDISASEEFYPTLGHMNTYQRLADAHTIQAHPANRAFTNIGEIGSLFRMPLPFVEEVTEPDVRIDLTNRIFQHLTNYLTLFDPSFDGIDNDGDSMVADEQDPAMTPEFKIPGRININTAPWYVIAQLPWLAFDELHPGKQDPNLARAIVAYRDKRPLVDTRSIPGFVIADYTDRTLATESPVLLREDPGFASTAELANVVNRFDKPDMDPNYRNFSMRYYLDGLDQPGFPDLTTASVSEGDGATDDFEERDLILTRISNLVTVRSDVFSAYILVRIGADGPQKRVLAILDRSNVYTAEDRVRIRALHPVPDPW